MFSFLWKWINGGGAEVMANQVICNFYEPLKLNDSALSIFVYARGMSLPVMLLSLVVSIEKFDRRLRSCFMVLDNLGGVYCCPRPNPFLCSTSTSRVFLTENKIMFLLSMT